MKNDNRDIIIFKNIFCISGFCVSLIFSIWLLIEQCVFFNASDVGNPIIGWVVVFCILTAVLITFFIIGAINISGNSKDKNTKRKRWIEIEFLVFVFMIINIIIYIVLYFIVQESIYSSSSTINILNLFALPLYTFLLIESVLLYLIVKQPVVVIDETGVEQTKNSDAFQSLPPRPTSPEEVRIQNLKNELEKKIAISQAELEVKELTQKYIDLQNKIKNKE